MVIVSKNPGSAELINAEEVLKKAGLKLDMKAADFGCGGRAYFTLQAAKTIGQDGLVYAIDVLKSNLKSVEELAKFYNLRNIKTIWADLEILNSTKIEKESLDFVIIANLFFQTKNHHKVWQNVSQILQSSGRVFVADWKEISSPIGPPLTARVKNEEIKKMARENSFSLVEEFPAGPYHFGLVFVKR